MKVLMATPSYRPIIGGTETCVRELSLALRRQGQTVDVLTVNMDAKWHPRWKTIISNEDGGRVFRWGAWNPTGWIRTPLVNRLVGRHLDAFLIGRLQRLAMIHLVLRPGILALASNYDVVHCHDEVDLTLPLVTRPHVMHIHTMAETFHDYRASFPARCLLRRCARRWVANSLDSATKAVRLGVPANRVTTVVNGVDPQVFAPTNTHRNTNELLFVGRFVPRKGLSVLLAALEHVATPVTLRIVGWADDERYRQELQSAVAALNRAGPHRLHLLGPCTGQQLVSLYQNAAIFVCPSLIEPFGIVAVEAMSCATPVIASKVDGLTEVVEDGVTGLLFEPGDHHALAILIERLLRDDALRSRLGENGREKVLSSFTWDRAAAALRRVYAEATDA